MQTQIALLLKHVCSLYSGVYPSEGPPVILAAITWEQEGAGEIQAGNAQEDSSVHKRT